MHLVIHAVRILPLLSAVTLAACGGKSAPAGSSSAPSTGGDTFAAQKSGPIAPGCAGAVCAEVDVGVKLACRDTVSQLDYTMATAIQGKTEEVSCYGDKNTAGGLDLVVGVNPPSTAPDDVHGSNSVWFRLRNYTGPGTYPLENLADDGDHTGLKVVGATAGHTEKVLTVGTVSCIPKACEAIVAEGSEPIPTDEMSTHEFRVRVEVRCPRGGTIGNMYCEDGNQRCTFSETPTLLADVACRQ